MKFLVEENVSIMILTPIVLLDSNVQRLMSCKAIAKGFGLTGADLKPWLYQNLPSMGKLEKAQRLTKHEVVIQVNPKKLTYYSTM